MTDTQRRYNQSFRMYNSEVIKNNQDSVYNIEELNRKEATKYTNLSSLTDDGNSNMTEKAIMNEATNILNLKVCDKKG